MAVKIYKNKIVITDFQNDWQEDSAKGHIFNFAHGKTFKDAKPFIVEVRHSDKVRSSDGRWHKVKK